MYLWEAEFVSEFVLEPEIELSLSCVLLQNLALCCLGISKIHHLIQQLVNDDKVVPDTLLLQYLEVFGEHLHNLVEE